MDGGEAGFVLEQARYAVVREDGELVADGFHWTHTGRLQAVGHLVG